jgi:branched-chain amino acid aminotransferase
MSQNPKVWLNGRLVPESEARLSFLSPGLHYGLAAFEGIRCYAGPSGPAIFRLQEHVERLFGSAHILGLRDLPWSALDITNAIKETVRASGLDECYIRPVIYIGEGRWNLTVDGGQPHLGIAVWPWTSYLGEEALALGVRANVSSFTRHHTNVMMTKAKISGNYANSVLAKTESLRLGFDEAIMLDPQGYVAECTGENIFVVRRGTVLTPPGATILEGITRDSVITLARDLGHDVVEQMMSRDVLYVADEVFVCGTAAEVIALREIDGRTIGSGRTGSITRALQQAYRAAVTGQHPRSADWLDPVNPGSRTGHGLLTDRPH